MRPRRVTADLHGINSALQTHAAPLASLILTLACASFRVRSLDVGRREYPPHPLMMFSKRFSGSFAGSVMLRHASVVQSWNNVTCSLERANQEMGAQTQRKEVGRLGPNAKWPLDVLSRVSGSAERGSQATLKGGWGGHLDVAWSLFGLDAGRATGISGHGVESRRPLPISWRVRVVCACVLQAAAL